MSFQPTIISYRSHSDQTSHFLNVEDLVKSDDFQKISEVYENIFNSVTAYDPNHADSLIKVENTLYKRIIKLETDKANEYAKKNTGWKAIIYSVLTLGIRALVFKLKEMHMNSKVQSMHKEHARFSRSLEQMQFRQMQKELHPKPEAIQQLENRRLGQLDQELGRLKSIERINKSLGEVTKRKNLSLKHQVAYGHSLELREQLKDTHYVINHGQNLQLMVVNILARKLKREFEPLFYESYEPLRHNTALRHIREDTHTIAWYQNTISRRKIDDHGLRKELLCGDCMLESTLRLESALDFFSGSKNIAATDSYFAHNLLLTIVQDYIPDFKTSNRLCDDLVNLLQNCPEGGNLYSICIPKEKFDESCYFSKPYGMPLENQKYLKTMLDDMQAGKEPCGYPQVRVLTHKIRAEDGFYVVLNSTLSDYQLLKIEEEVTTCIQAALTGYRVQKRPKRIFS